MPNDLRAKKNLQDKQSPMDLVSKSELKIKRKKYQEVIETQNNLDKRLELRMKRINAEQAKVPNHKRIPLV